MKPTLSRALVLAFALGVLGSLSLRVAEVSGQGVTQGSNCDHLEGEEQATCQAQANAMAAQHQAQQAQGQAQEAITQAQLQDAGPKESGGGGGCS